MVQGSRWCGEFLESRLVNPSSQSSIPAAEKRTQHARILVDVVDAESTRRLVGLASKHAVSPSEHTWIWGNNVVAFISRVV